MRFSTPRMTPAEVDMPIAVLPSLMASREYSTWKRRPSGEKVLFDISDVQVGGASVILDATICSTVS